MKTLRKLPDGRWLIARRPRNRQLGLAMLSGAAVLAVVTFIFPDDDAAFLWLEVLVLGVIGGLYARTNTRVVIDAEVGTIDLGHGPERGRDFAAVRLESQLRTERDQEVRLYSVALTRLEAAEASITLTPSEAEAWKIAELLARAFDLPMLDSTDGRLIQRAPTQLDEPLGKRLACAGVLPLDPGPAPPGISCDASRGRLHLVWRAPMARLLMSLLVLAGMLVLALWLALGLDATLVGWSLAAFWIALGIAVVIGARGKGGNLLEISAGVLHHTTRFPYRRATIVPVQRIEHVRDQSRPSPTISLISDDDVVVLHGTEQQCSWLRRKLEHWLAANAIGHRDL